MKTLTTIFSFLPDPGEFKTEATLHVDTEGQPYVAVRLNNDAALVSIHLSTMADINQIVFALHEAQTLLADALAKGKPVGNVAD